MSSKPKSETDCTECGSADVEVVQWINANTGEVTDDFASHPHDPFMGQLAVTYCANCDEATTLDTRTRCPHSVCSQNSIDRGSTECIQGGDDE